MTIAYGRLRHWLWRLARRRHAYACGGSPYRVCAVCMTPNWCRDEAGEFAQAMCGDDPAANKRRESDSSLLWRWRRVKRRTGER